MSFSNPIRSSTIVRLAACAAICLGQPAVAAAQQCLPAMPSAHAPLLAELLRMHEIRAQAAPGRFLVRGSDDLARCPELWDLRRSTRLGPLTIAVAPTDLGVTLNSGYADDRNNGTLWSGRGVSAGVQTGVLARIGWLSAGFRPVITYQENRDFRVEPDSGTTHSEFASPLYPMSIDLPYRFGDDAFATVNAAGQSFVRLDAFGFALGASSENYWVGPSIRNPILMSNTAPGFPHAFFGTTRPLDLWLARVGFDVVIGRTMESDYWDANPENDRGDIVMWVIGVQPRWLEGLELGVTRVLVYRSPDARLLGDPEQLREFFFLGGARNIEGNELASIFLRWVLPESAAEFYGEWGREDTWATITDDLIPEIDHSQAYMIGFQKLASLGAGRHLRVHAELSHMQEKVERREDRPLPIFYLHHQAPYTHRGQLMGSGIGIGADAQYLAVDLVQERGFAGVFVERVRRHEGTDRSVEERAFHPFDHDTEVTAGLRGLLLRGDFGLGLTVSYSKRWNREFVEDDSNFRLIGELTWRPPLPSGSR